MSARRSSIFGMPPPDEPSHSSQPTSEDTPTPAPALPLRPTKPRQPKPFDRRRKRSPAKIPTAEEARALGLFPLKTEWKGHEGGTPYAVVKKAIDELRPEKADTRGPREDTEDSVVKGDDDEDWIGESEAAEDSSPEQSPLPKRRTSPRKLSSFHDSNATGSETYATLTMADRVKLRRRSGK